MATLVIILWTILPLYTECILFPGQDEGPLIAVLDILATKMDIFDPSGGVNATIIEEINLENGQAGGSCGIDFNYRGNMIYWTDVYAKKVYSLKAGDEEQEVILEGGLGSPEGLAYDWIHNNLYVSDWELHKIMVINPETGVRKTLLTDVHRVRDLEVDPRTGWLYWISGWDETALLMKSTLDGQNQVVISSDLRRPMSLSLDYDELKLYWTEIYPVNSIKSIRVDGEGQTIVHQLGSHFWFSPKYITVTKDYIYWTQGITFTVFGRAKNNSGEVILYRNLLKYGRWDLQKNKFMGILAIDPRKQTISVCGDNNGGCSHFCLPTLILSVPPYNCACPDGMDLMNDNSTCSGGMNSVDGNSTSSGEMNSMNINSTSSSGMNLMDGNATSSDGVNLMDDNPTSLDEEMNVMDDNSTAEIQI
ncbi:low-density lipoprotein receptor-related protein 4-like [Patella vulgata]|uniref:low-density lipoprotein receptor-related protein 4-like n=1 Tax=Patella vulgata TaxID=6465 RepID=UPI0024A9B4D3|nr:low-density lipoprotein receptor-related protein 4-like [Patella vulgata]